MPQGQDQMKKTDLYYSKALDQDEKLNPVVAKKSERPATSFKNSIAKEYCLYMSLR